jgi:hypothetical protein
MKTTNKIMTYVVQSYGTAVFNSSVYSCPISINFRRHIFSLVIYIHVCFMPSTLQGYKRALIKLYNIPLYDYGYASDGCFLLTVLSSRFIQLCMKYIRLLWSYKGILYNFINALLYPCRVDGIKQTWIYIHIQTWTYKSIIH